MLNMFLESRNWQFPSTARCVRTVEKLCFQNVSEGLEP